MVPLVLASLFPGLSWDTGVLERAPCAALRGIPVASVPLSASCHWVTQVVLGVI